MPVFQNSDPDGETDATVMITGQNSRGTGCPLFFYELLFSRKDYKENSCVCQSDNNRNGSRLSGRRKLADAVKQDRSMTLLFLPVSILAEKHSVSTQHPDASFEKIRNIENERTLFEGEVFLR